MSSITYNNKKKSPNLHAAVVESILLSCTERYGFDELVTKIQKVLPLSRFSVKKYLFFLIDHELISYRGGEQIYCILEDGKELLNIIIEKKNQNQGTINGFVISIE